MLANLLDFCRNVLQLLLKLIIFVCVPKYSSYLCIDKDQIGLKSGKTFIVSCEVLISCKWNKNLINKYFPLTQNKSLKRQVRLKLRPETSFPLVGILISREPLQVLLILKGLWRLTKEVPRKPTFPFPFTRGKQIGRTRSCRNLVQWKDGLWLFHNCGRDLIDDSLESQQRNQLQVVSLESPSKRMKSIQIFQWTWNYSTFLISKPIDKALFSFLIDDHQCPD